MSIHDAIQDATRSSKAIVVEFTRMPGKGASEPIVVVFKERKNHRDVMTTVHSLSAVDFASALEQAHKWLLNLNERTALIQHLNTGN